MQIKESYVSIAIVVLGWAVGAAWFLATTAADLKSVKEDLKSVKEDLKRIEQRQEKLYWYVRAGNEGVGR